MAVNDLMMQIKIAVLGDNGAAIRKLESQLKALQSTANQLQNIKLAGLTADLANLRSALSAAKTLNLGTLPADMARFKSELLAANTASAGFRSTIKSLNNDSQKIRQLDISPIRKQIQDINQGLQLTKLTNLTPLQNTFRAASNEVLNTQIKIRDLTEKLKNPVLTGGQRLVAIADLDVANSQLNKFKNDVDSSRIAINKETSSLATNTLAQKQAISGLRQQITAKEQLILANQRQVAQEKVSLLAEERKATAAKNNVGLTQAQIKAEQEASRIRQDTIRNSIVAKEQEITAARKTIASNKEQITSTKALLDQQRALSKVGTASSKASSAFKDFSSSIGFLFGPQMAGLAVAGTIFGLTSAFIEANKQVEQLVRGLNAISGGQGRAEFQYLVDVSNKLGVSIQESAHSFLQLEATTAGTAIEGAKTKQIFESFARALNVTGADAVTFNRAFRSISQSLSKGQLYAEELKGQLAEALPGAIQVFAKAIDVTPKKFLAMVKAGQFAGQTLYDLFGLVSKQLDKTYKVGGEKDFTFIQKANLAKNAFVELSVALGDTGIWKTLSNGMLLLRDGLKAATASIPELSNTMIAEWAMIKSLYGGGAKELVDALSIIGDGWKELAKLIPESISDISFQTLLDLPITIKKAANDALTEIKVLAIQTRAAIDAVGGQGASDSIDIGRGLEMQWTWFKDTIASAGEAAAAISIYIDKMREAKDQRSSIMPEGRKAKPFTEEMLPFEQFLKSYRATNIDVPIQVSNETIAKLRKQIDYLNGLLNSTTDVSKQDQYRGFIKQNEQRIENEIAAQQQLTENTKQENYNKWQALLKQNEAYEKEALARAKQNAGIRSKVEADIAAVRKEGDVNNQAVDQQKQIREETEKKLWLDQQLDKWAQVASSRARDNQRSIEQVVAEKERDVAITKNQLAYEKKILDIKQEQRDAQVGFAKARYQEWVKSGALTQESADFLIKSAESDSALKAIRDAQDAVELYNNELKKGDAISSDELKLSREKALELLKLGSEKAKQTGNEYKYNELVKERIRLLGEEKSKANEGADAVYRAKIKMENPKAEADAARKAGQDEADKAPVAFKAIIKPDLDTTQQSGLMFASLRQEYQQTQQIVQQPLRFVVDDAQVNAALQGLNLYQAKIQDIKTVSLPNGQTEIIVTPKINEPALQEGFRYIKTAAEQSAPMVPVKPVVDQPSVEKVKKTSEEVRKEVLGILDNNGKKVNFIVSATGITKTSEDMKRLADQKEIPVTAFTDQKSLDDTKKKFDDAGNYIKDGLRGATTIAPQGIQNTLDTAFGKGKYKLEIVPTITGGVTEDGWIKNNEIKRNLIITPIEGDTSAINGMIEQQTNNVKSGFDNAWQMLREFDAKNQTVIESTPIDKQAKLDTTVALEEDAALVAQLSTTVTKYVDIIYRSSGSDGATVKAATGGYLSGYGGGDRIHALLEAGEFILRKEAVRKLGLNNVFALNNLNIPKPSRSVDNMSIPSFSGGGYVGSSNTININVPGSKSIQVSGSRESAMALANLLTRVGRAA